MLHLNMRLEIIRNALRAAERETQVGKAIEFIYVDFYSQVIDKAFV